MTNEEAREFLQTYKEKYLYLVDKKRVETERKIMSTLPLAIEALEKQIAKKPERIEGTLFGKERYYHKCPNCGDPYVDDSYCPICGQAIDWSDEE